MFMEMGRGIMMAYIVIVCDVSDGTRMVRCKDVKIDGQGGSLSATRALAPRPLLQGRYIIHVGSYLCLLPQEIPRKAATSKRRWDTACV